MIKALSDKKQKIVENYYKLYPFEFYQQDSDIMCTRSGIKLERIDGVHDVKVLDANGFYLSIGNGFILDLIYEAIVGNILTPKKKIQGKI